MLKTINFLYMGFSGLVSVQLKNIDPSNPTRYINQDWDELQQELFDQIDDSRKFTSDDLSRISELSTKDFLKCLREDNEDIHCYNRARAIWEYKTELISAAKGNRPTTKWAEGLDALRAGAVAELFNY